MKDYLLDLIQHTNGLGFIDIAKIEGTEEETTVTAYNPDRTVVVYGTFKTPIPGLSGTLGMPNLSNLKTILGFDEYDDTAIINVTMKTDENGTYPEAIHFQTNNGDFVNDYRLMQKNAVQNEVKSVTFKGANWDVTFEPSIAGVLRLKKQAQANSVENNFTAKVENGDFKIYFGDHATHSGNFVFQPSVSGTLNRSWQYPVKAFLAIMDLPGDKTISFADAGAAEITVDSGISTWRYLLPAQTK